MKEKIKVYRETFDRLFPEINENIVKPTVYDYNTNIR